MAQGTKSTPAPTAPPNGVTGSPHPPPVNRKKQKRREKEAAKKAAGQQKQNQAPAKHGVPSQQQQPHAQRQSPRRQVPQYQDAEYDDPPYDDEGEYYSEDEAGGHYMQSYQSNGHYQQAYAPAPAPVGSSTKKKKKSQPSLSQQSSHNYHHMSSRPPPVSHMSNDGDHKNGSDKDRIWNTSTVEERERIREFWLSLGEDERKSLVKIEKEAVLRKMKEQQKHSCSCSVCGRKRTAIEEELEVLYDAYYEELEQYVYRYKPDCHHFLSSITVLKLTNLQGTSDTSHDNVPCRPRSLRRYGRDVW